MTGLKASVTLTPWRLFLDEFHRQRPLVVLKADIEKWALQDGPLAAGDPPLRAVVRRGVCPAEYMEIIIVNIVQALVAAKHTAIPAPHCYPSIDANSSK